MVKKGDSLYFQAIAEAASGKLDIKVIDFSLYQARKAANREDYSTAARHYQRVFHVWQVFFQSADPSVALSFKEVILPALNEYVAVLQQLDRQERAQEVSTAINSLSDLHD